MAKLEDVFSCEWDRENPAEWNKIHLYKMGDFWRAYEWSAWLISVISYNDNVRMMTKDRKPLHVTSPSLTKRIHLAGSNPFQSDGKAYAVLPTLQALC